MAEERCCMCDNSTGRAGAGEDSIYLDFGNGGCLGPLCSDCYNSAGDAFSARVRELETENERLRGGLKEIRGMCDGAICYYTATGQHVNVTPTLTLSAAKKLLPITTAALAAKETTNG